MVSIFNQATQARKKPEDDLPEWFRNAPDAKDEPAEELPGWFTSAPDAGPDPDHIEDEEITTWDQSMRLSGLEKPEDKLRALREVYPDAVPYGEDNFIFTDPETGKTHIFNKPGWIPNTNDFAASLPGAAEVTGAILGGVGGGTVGAAVGSPSGPGAVVPATAGALAGAGLGGASFREAMQDIIQWTYGDDDTRTTEEVLEDFGKNAASNAAGEGIGRGVIAVGRPIVRSAHRMVVGGPVDKAAALTALREAEELGLRPTLGTVTQNPKTLELEARLAKDAPSGLLARSISELDEGLSGKVEEIATSIFSKPGTPDSVGTLLRDAATSAESKELARLKSMYDEFEGMTTGAHISGQNLAKTLLELQAEKAGLGQAEKLAKGPTIDNALKYAKAINADVKKGLPIKDARAFRTDINPLAYGKKEDPFSRDLFQRMYKATTDDVLESAKSVSDDAFKKMQEADAAYSAYKTTGTKKILEKAIKETEPTKVFQFYSRQIKDSPQKLATVRDALTKDGDTTAWDAFVSHHVRQLGQQTTKTGTKFNPATFVKQIERMPKESKDVLFSGKHAGYLEDLQKLQRFSANRAGAKGVRAPGQNIVDQVIDATMNRYSFGVLGKIKDATVDHYRERLLTNPAIVRDLVGLPAKNMKKGFAASARNYLLDAAARAGELEAMRSLLDEIEKDNEKR